MNDADFYIMQMLVDHQQSMIEQQRAMIAYLEAELLNMKDVIIRALDEHVKSQVYEASVGEYIHITEEECS